MTICAPPSRREIFVAAAAGATLATACSRPHRRSGWLSYLVGTEPDTLDAAKCAGGSEILILAALFEPLTLQHPETMAPMAGLATHYNIERDGMRYTFYLRGHSSTRGVKLPGANALPTEFSRGLPSAPDDRPARWSDGKAITAHDVVYSWRRYLTPETGCIFANTLYCVSNAEAVASGKLPPEQLGVQAVDDYTFQIDLNAPAPYLLMLCSTSMTLPLPRHVIRAAREQGREASWVEPGRMVSSGPFVLSESKARERTVVARNPHYYDAHVVGVDGVRFSVADGAMVLNLYRAGLADSMDGRTLPLQLVPAMRRLDGFHSRPACASHNWRISAKRAPLDNVMLRYALNMATDKVATTRFLGSAQKPAKCRVPPIQGYQSPTRLPVEINGSTIDILQFNPRAARELWAAASHETHAPLPIYYGAVADSHVLAQVLQYQWRNHLGIETRLMPLEMRLYAQTVFQDGDFSGVAEDSYIANYPDPSDLLELYAVNYPNWSDPAYDRMLSAATSIAEPALRMTSLAQCEASLLKAMPFIPLYFDTWNYLERPDVHGLTLNPSGVPSFKYAWIQM